MTGSVTGWAQKNDRLIKNFKFKDFNAAIAFMVEVARFCDAQDHHPEWTNIYNKLHVELTSHDAGGVTDKDKKLAAHMDEVFARG